MFTGLIEALGRCVRVEETGGGRRIWVDEPSVAAGTRVGDSVAVNGVCLTVVAVDGGRLVFDLVRETLRVTTLDGLRAGDPVNLERSLRWGDRLGGHLVLGHVDGVGRIVTTTPCGDASLLWVSVPARLMPYLMPKGSVAVDGVSLTVVDTSADSFSVALVPHTIRHTTLGHRLPGDAVNIEVDVLARYAARWARMAHTVGATDDGGRPGGSPESVARHGDATHRSALSLLSELAATGPASAAAPDALGTVDPPATVPAGPSRTPRAGSSASRRAGVDELGPPAPSPSPQRVELALKELRAGRMVVVVDDEDREAEGDLVMAADRITPAHVNFMLEHGRGLICVPMSAERCQALDLPLMVDPPRDPMATPFTLSVDARHGVRTGISAQDRARTIRTLADPQSTPGDLVRPGHVFPLRARPWGVLERRGHTEAAVDLMRLAGLQPVAAICEILAPDGRAARGADLVGFARRHGLTLVSVRDIAAYRVRRESLVRPLAGAELPTEHGTFILRAFQYLPTGETHLALVMGNPTGNEPVLGRVHSECLTGDALRSMRCDCGEQLRAALGAIAEAGTGVLVYLRQEGRGIGLGNKIRAYELQDRGLDTVEANRALGLPADARDYAPAAQILRHLGIGRVRLLTNNPDKLRQLALYGIDVVERLPLQVHPHPTNRRYLAAKRDRLGHWLEGLEEPDGPPAATARPAGGPGGHVTGDAGGELPSGNPGRDSTEEPPRADRDLDPEGDGHDDL